MLTTVGADAFAERARHELAATGERPSTSGPVAPVTTLTAQEAQIAALAGSGLTNAEIGAQMFLSQHTVEWHLRKVFAKLGITLPPTAPPAHGLGHVSQFPAVASRCSAECSARRRAWCGVGFSVPRPPPPRCARRVPRSTQNWETCPSHKTQRWRVLVSE